MKVANGDVWFSQKVTGAKNVVTEQHRCHSASFVVNISGAKFEENCSNNSGYILDSVFYCLNGTIYDVITFLICIIQKKRCHSPLP